MTPLTSLQRLVFFVPSITTAPLGGAHTMTQRINDHLADRLATLLAQDAAVAAAEKRFYAALAQLEQPNPALHAELDDAFSAWSDLALSGAWLDGWHCGLNPDTLVLAVGEDAA